MAKARKQYKFKALEPLTGFLFWIVIGGDELETVEWWTKKYKLGQWQSGGGNLGSFSHSSVDPYLGLIWLKDSAGGSTIAHEVCHAVNHVCRILNLNPAEADEFSALYTGWLYLKINKFYEKKGIK